MGKRAVDKRVKKVIQDLPFQPGDSKPKRAMKDRQRRWLLNGLKHIGAPIVFAQLIALLFAVPGLDWSKPGQHVETFAGCMSVTQGEWEEGRRAVPMDIDLDPSTMNLLDDRGFCNALFAIANLEPGSGSLTAPVCASFVFLSKGSTLRSRRDPEGRTDLECVANGNLLAARACLLCILCACKCIWWVLEQPSSSTMELLPVFQRMMGLITVRRKFIRMSDYGGPTHKPTFLYTGHSEIDSLSLFKTRVRLENREMAVKYEDSRGVVRVKGGRDLKLSQSYPREFGSALSKCRTLHWSDNMKKAKKFLKLAQRTGNSFNKTKKVNNMWIKAAKLESVMNYLAQR